MKVTNSLQGWFTLKVHKGDAEQPSQVASFENLITDSGLNYIGQGSFLSRCLVGTGNTPPDVLQTTLASLVASVGAMSTNYTATTSPPYYGTFIRKYRFNPGVATGNLTEVGVGWGFTGSTAVFSRALIKDINGDPTTLTILPDEFLDVTYELRVYPTVTDVVVPGTTFTGFTSDVTIRPSFIADGNMLAFLDNTAIITALFGPTVYSGSIGPITGSPSGTSEILPSSSDVVQHSPYVVGSYKRVATLTVPLNNGNFAGGIGAIRLATSFGYFQLGFTPPVVKNATQQLILNLELAWGRYAP